MKRNVYILMLVFVFLFVSCEKDEYFTSGDVFSVEDGSFVKTTTPYVTTSDVADVTMNSAKLGGCVFADGNLEIVARGVCISKRQNPTIEDNCIVASAAGVGSFVCHATNLSSNTTYYVRAYATNEKGTSYGEQKTFTTERRGGWIYYDNGEYTTSLAYASKSPIYWGVRFPGSYLAEYEGYKLTKVLLYINSSYTYKANLEVYVGDWSTPGNMVSNSKIEVSSTSDINDWIDFRIHKAVEIDPTQTLWITFNAYSTSSVEYPAAACSYVGNPDSDWVSSDGVVWEHLSDFEMNYTWMIRAYLEDDSDRTVTLDMEN